MNLFRRPTLPDSRPSEAGEPETPIDLAEVVRSRMETAHRAWSVATADVPIEREELAIVFGMLTAIGQHTGLDRAAILKAMERVLGPEYGTCIIAGSDSTLREYVSDGGRIGVALSPDRITARAMRYVVEVTHGRGVKRWNLQ